MNAHYTSNGATHAAIRPVWSCPSRNLLSVGSGRHRYLPWLAGAVLRPFQMGHHFQFCANFFQGARRSPHPLLGAQISQQMSYPPHVCPGSTIRRPSSCLAMEQVFVTYLALYVELSCAAAAAIPVALSISVHPERRLQPYDQELKLAKITNHLVSVVRLARFLNGLDAGLVKCSESGTPAINIRMRSWRSSFAHPHPTERWGWRRAIQANPRATQLPKGPPAF
jgi:hypothetical protein